MPKQKLKLKTHKGAAKRFKITATGKVRGSHAYGRHILTSKPSKRKRKLGERVTASKPDAKRVHAMLPYGL